MVLYVPAALDTAGISRYPFYVKKQLEAALTAAAEASGVIVCEQASLPVSGLVFSPELYDTCKTNVCGHYNTSWTCPPAAGTMEEQRAKIQCYENVYVFTTRHDLEDSFDYEGMTLGRDRHAVLTLEFRTRLNGLPVYGAGSCPSCRSAEGERKVYCTFPNPCPFPLKQIGSIEAAGINVTELSKTAGVKYNNGPNTVTYFSMALYGAV